MQSNRIEREKKTVNKMIALYCKAYHNTEVSLCDDCKGLVDYSNMRLDKCRFGEMKPVCAKCPVHCYKPDMRVKIIKIMKFSGPRMIFHKPGLAILHITDKFRKYSAINLLKAKAIKVKNLK
jgi:hypothetical protein